MKHFWYFPAVALFLTACGSGGGESRADRGILGPGANFTKAVAEAEALADRIDAIGEAEDYTEFDDLPSGTATYRGLAGATGGENGVALIGDLTLNANFDTGQVDGNIRNFTSNGIGFENPNGRLSIEAEIYEDEWAEASLRGLAEGTLSQGDYRMLVELYMEGYFIGNQAKAIEGYLEGTVDFYEGNDFAGRYEVDGGFGAEKR